MVWPVNAAKSLEEMKGSLPSGCLADMHNVTLTDSLKLANHYHYHYRYLFDYKKTKTTTTTAAAIPS